jgi:DNA-binding response OmpR family regulator
MSEPHKNILIVEDEAVLLGVLTEKLEKEGFNVITAKDGAQGLELALGRLPDLILLDNRMPGMTGYEMLTRLREKGRWGEFVPVIFLSNVEPNSKEERRDIEATGAAYYLIKGETSMDEIVAKVREVLRN